LKRCRADLLADRAHSHDSQQNPHTERLATSGQARRGPVACSRRGRGRALARPCHRPECLRRRRPPRVAHAEQVSCFARFRREDWGHGEFRGMRRHVRRQDFPGGGIPRIGPIAASPTGHRPEYSAIVCGDLAPLNFLPCSQVNVSDQRSSSGDEMQSLACFSGFFAESQGGRARAYIS
jgi:hypothetical protein